nr:hypothetical protein [Candidatus Korarchaeota archaeon]NIU85252.1 hypothetical protein [Candidatus Thorarchaeota archaeon]NIW15342.1 hypothetical protein [Candidatus Thorarchaeota archaeon]NIW53302.1 hypothetical protein [Candidatus Korarchaeota archaeon]
VRKEEWLIDADSHLAEYIHIEIAGDPTQVTTISVLEHSGGLRSTDEIHVLSIAAGLLSLFIVPITLWEIATIGQKKEAEHLVSWEKKRLRSKTYREQYLKKRGEKENDVDITDNVNDTEKTERRGITNEEFRLFERSAFIFGGGLLSFLANWIIKGRHYPMWQGTFLLLSVSILFTGLTLAFIHLISLLIKKVLIKIRPKQLDKRRKPTRS